MKELLGKILGLFKNTTVKVISLLPFLCLIGGYFIFPDFYKSQWDKVQSYYYVYQGDKAYKTNHPQEAINNYERALSLHPKHVRARYNLANLYVAYEDYHSALMNYKKALELKPDLMVARIDYAIVLSEATFNYDSAIKEYDTAIEKAPKWTYIPFIVNTKKMYKYNKGVAYYNQGLAWRGKSLLHGEDRYQSRIYLKNAVESYKKALKTLKEYDVYYNLAIANQLLRNNYAAGKNYCMAIEKQPMNYEAHYNLAILLKGMKKYVDSAEEFKKAGFLLDLKGDSTRTRYIYDVLNEVNIKLALDEEYQNLRQKLDEKERSMGGVTYINGKLVTSEEFDKAVMKNFKTCENKQAFETEEDLEL